MSQRTHKQSVDEFRVAKFDELQAENAQLRGALAKHPDPAYSSWLETADDLAKQREENDSLRSLVRRLMNRLAEEGWHSPDTHPRFQDDQNKKCSGCDPLISEARAATEGK